MKVKEWFRKTIQIHIFFSQFWLATTGQRIQAELHSKFKYFSALAGNYGIYPFIEEKTEGAPRSLN